MIDPELLQAGKLELKESIISEYGEDVYNEIIVAKCESLHKLKLECDEKFGENDYQFREEIRTVVANESDDEDEIIVNFLLYDIALDTIL